MPRGVAIPELNERLFDAVERLWERDGALSTRGITAEAGCAKGMLHNHFGELDKFLAQYALNRFHAALHGLSELPETAGQGEVHANLVRATAQFFQHPVVAAHSIVALYPAVAQRLREARQRQDPASALPGLADMEDIFTRYLDAEKLLGRVRADCDTGAVSLALVATAHHLLLMRRPNADAARAMLHRVLDELSPAGERGNGLPHSV